MFRWLFTAPRRLPQPLADELSSLCHAQQIERLAMPKTLRKDVGLDCGCTDQSADLTSLRL